MRSRIKANYFVIVAAPITSNLSATSLNSPTARATHILSVNGCIAVTEIAVIVVELTLVFIHTLLVRTLIGNDGSSWANRRCLTLYLINWAE